MVSTKADPYNLLPNLQSFQSQLKNPKPCDPLCLDSKQGTLEDTDGETVPCNFKETENKVHREETPNYWAANDCRNKKCSAGKRKEIF